MSEFHRMITYLYLYEHGTKRHNTGFAKIEKRDGQCLIEIHLKNTGHNTPSAPVYFYAQNGIKHPGILVGTMSLYRGNGDFKTILKGEPLAGSRYSFQDVKGIFIPLSEEIMFVSQWDDNEFVRENFVTPEKQSSTEEPSAGTASNENPPAGKTSAGNPSTGKSSAGNPSTGKASVGNPSTGKSSAGNPSTGKASVGNPSMGKSSVGNPSTRKPSNGSPLQVIPPVKKPKPQAHSQSPASGPAHLISAIPVPASSADLEAAEAVPKQMPSSSETRPLPTQAAQSQEALPENWEQKWKFILENYPVMTPFAGDESTICVRLELKDIRLLPKPYWYLGNNSFLLHGFFNYRYLILGAVEKSEKKRWFIGIPGVYQNPERVMAALFGFPEFRNEKSVPVNTGEFGYWYRYLN